MAGLDKPRKLKLIIAISLAFFLAEIAVGFYTRSLALVADAFHYLSFGWQRATLLGAFFNGVFLLALGVSIFLQAIERFVKVEPVENPFLVMIIGCVGFALNVVSAAILHEHDHETQDTAGVVQGGRLELAMPIGSATGQQSVRLHDDHRHETGDASGRGKETDLGIMGVLIHVMGDALNNIGVIIAGAVVWKTKSPARFYADPAVSVAIALMIFLSSIPLISKSGIILLESAPAGLDVKDVQHDIEKIDGVVAVHELHVWRLNQQKTLASAHIVVSEAELPGFLELAKTVKECLHAYNIHGVTLQPELAPSSMVDTPDADNRGSGQNFCMLRCDPGVCSNPSCCE